MYFGLLTMFIQGLVLTITYLQWSKGEQSIKKGVKFSLLIGLFFVSYLALVEPDKYTVANVTEWILVEATAGLVQFTIFGILLGKFILPD